MGDIPRGSALVHYMATIAAGALPLRWLRTAVDKPGDQVLDLRKLERLEKHGIRPELPLLLTNIRATGDDEYGNGGRVRVALQLSEDLRAILVGQAEVQRDERRADSLTHHEGSRAIFHRQDPVAFIFQYEGEDISYLITVVNDYDCARLIDHGL